MVEIRGGRRRRQVVVGFGINVTAAPPPEELARPAACLADVVDDASALERIEILRAVLVRLDHWVDAARTGRTEQLHQSWLRRCGMINTRQTVESAGRRVTGRVLDVSTLSGLILLSDSGEQVHLPAATSTIVR
jgi:biotin-(acetyl-CoA carboxylase) ligase